MAHHGQLVIHSCGRNINSKQQCRLKLAAWNVRTLLDAPGRPERRSAILARKLARYDIDIAALSETRISAENQFEEVGAGYTFFTIGQVEGKPRQAGVGFAIKSALVSRLQEHPKAVNLRLTHMKLELAHGQTAVLISAYAPTMDAADEVKEEFYSTLNDVVSSVSYKHRLFILGDLNARVGRDYSTWPKVLGHHSVGNENSNGTLLLQFCAQHELVITNTLFQQANKYKCTWMHPRSRHWHMLDYVITRQKDARDVHLTRVMRGAVCWSDHCLVRSTVILQIVPRKTRRSRASRRKKLDVNRHQPWR